MSFTSYRQQNDIFKYKKRLPIKSLEAAICNVALFKNMKQKQFRQTIYISYNQDGVILQALNQIEWQKACGYVLDFLIDKKIALLTYGYEKEIYEELIIKGLKQYTRKIKQQGDECPYINIIHYQKLRKSCEYMDKQRYMDPLKYWEHKFKINPNFAFLIVQPKQKFYQVKRYLLQVLLKRQVTLKIQYVSLWECLYLFYNSKNKDQIRQLCEKKIVQVQVFKKKEIQDEIQSQQFAKYLKKYDKPESQKSQQRSQLMKVLDQSEHIVRIINYSDLLLNQYEVKIIKHTPNLAKLGLQYISSKQIQKQIKTISKYLRSPDISQQSSQQVQTNGKKSQTATQIYELLQKQLLGLIKQQNQSQPGQSSQTLYSMIPYKRCQKQKYLNLLQKLLKTTTQMKNKNVEQINNQLKKLQICDYDQIQFLNILPLKKTSSLKQRNNKKSKQNAPQKTYNIYKASINDCPYMVIQYNQIPINDLDTFVLYLQQLKNYYCSYLVRFYGISIRYGENIHQSHAQILKDINPGLLEKIKNSQFHSYKELSRSKLQEYSYYLIFDYHHRNVQTLIQNDLILDNLQIANMALQLLYLCQYLHSHDQPRCFGMINFQEIYWPLSMVLPYLGQNSRSNIIEDKKKTSAITHSSHRLSKFKLNCSQEGFQGDVKLIGKLIEQLMTAQNDPEKDISSSQQINQSFNYDQGTIDKQIQNLWKQMIKQSKYDRITIARAITALEDILCV